MTETDTFFSRVETFMTRIATELGLGTAKGHYEDRQVGRNRSFTIFGTYGKLWIACIFESSEPLLAIEQARLRWYVTDALSPMELDRIHGKPLILRIVREFDELEADIRLLLGYLHDRTVEEVIEELTASSFRRVRAAGDPSADPDNELPS